MSYDPEFVVRINDRTPHANHYLLVSVISRYRTIHRSKRRWLSSRRGHHSSYAYTIHHESSSSPILRTCFKRLSAIPECVVEINDRTTTPLLVFVSVYLYWTWYMINTEKHAQDSGDNAQRSDATNAATNSRYPLTLAFRSQPKNNSSSRNYKQNINAILFA